LITINDKSAAVGAQNERHKYSLSVRLRRSTAIVTRWLHLYLSMISFAVVLFFAATGITLNHAEWFTGHEQTTHYQGIVSAALLHESSDKQPDRLGIVELLRNRHKIHGAVSDFRTEDSQITVSFRGPGYAADAFIDGNSGSYDLTETRSGFVAVINDLHKGRDTGKTWSAVIDISAALLILVSLTGLLLIWFVYKRRTSGLILAAAAGFACWLIYRIFVP
jgi:hypothetical protein